MTFYTTTNFPTKKALKQAIADDHVVRLKSVGLGTPKTDGLEYVSGPWFPEPHKWYAEVEVVNGIITKVT